jgi:hypothetical protein
MCNLAHSHTKEEIELLIGKDHLNRIEDKLRFWIKDSENSSELK